MGFANPVVIQLSSLGTSRAVALDWMGGSPVGVAITSTAAAGSFVYSLQYCLDDLQQTVPAAVQWISDPNCTALTSNSSGVFTYTAPITGVRLSSSGAPPSAITMRITQGSWL